MSTYDTLIQYGTFYIRYDSYHTTYIAYHTILTTMIMEMNDKEILQIPTKQESLSSIGNINLYEK